MENIPKDKGENIKCYVRCRPLNNNEKTLGAGCIKINEENKSIQVENKVIQSSINQTNNNNRLENKIFNYDWVFGEETSQENFYNHVATPVLKSFFQGYNCTMFAYGQTGAGKSFTMLGPTDSVFEYKSDNHGLIPRIINSIFDKDLNKKFIINPEDDIENFQNLKFDVKCSCLEFYQEQIIDLLGVSSKENSESLIIREDPKKGMFIEGIREESISSQKNAMELIMLGLKNRHQASTNMNAESSRSHLIFTIFMNYSFTNKEGLITSRSSRMHLIDLAGSERQKSTMAVGDRIKEAGMINKSLSLLGNVINALVEFNEGKTKYVPFRDGKLTFFLKDSLGGNSKTTIIANISQSIIQLQETLSTLKFVQRAKLIKNKATINENVNATMKVLQDEIKRLKEELELSKKIQLENSSSFLKRNNTESYTNANSFLSKSTDGEKSLSEIKRENMIHDKTKEMKNLIAKIDNLFALSPQLEAKMKILDDIYMDEFYENKSKYLKNFENLINGLQEKMNIFGKTVSYNEEVLLEFKEAFQIKNNSPTFEKMQNFLDELKLFKYDFELNSYLDIYKLEEQNRLLKNEIDTYKSISEILHQNKLYSKITNEGLNFYNSSIKEFIDLQKELKEFFKQNLISKNGVKTLKEINLALIDQMTLDKMKFQLEEYKANEENKSKQIEELESENFLLNMEIMNLKSGENNLNIFDNNANKSNSKNADSIDLGNTSALSNNIELIFEGKDEKKTKKIPKMKNSISQSNSNLMSRGSLKYSESLKNLNKKQNESSNFIENLKNSLKNHQSEKDKDKENGSEVGKLKEKLYDALIHLEEKNTEIQLMSQKIEELEIINEGLEKNISMNNITIKSLKDEIDTLYDSNNFLSLDIEKLNEKQEKLTELLNDDLPDLIKLFEKNTQLINRFGEDYKSEMNNFKGIYSGFIGKTNNIITKLSSSLANATKKIKKSEETNKEITSSIKVNLFDIFETITISIKEFEGIFNKKLNENETKILNLTNFIEKTKSSFDKKLKKQQNIFQTKIYQKLLSSLNKVGISSTKEDFDELIEKLETYLNNKIFDYLNIDKNKLSKLEKKVLELKEEKKTLNNDLILIRTDFSDALSNMALNNKIALLMKFKEENFKLRNEINQIRKKNDTLEKQFNKIQENNQINSNFNKKNSFMLDNQINLNTSNASFISNSNNFNTEEFLRLKKDYHEILEKIFELEDNESNKNLLSKINQKEKLAFRKALEILNKINETNEYDKFFNKISYNNEIKNKEELNYMIYNTEKNLTPENKLKKSTADFKKEFFKLEKEKEKTPIKKIQKNLKGSNFTKENSNENKTPSKYKTEINSNFTNFGNLASKNKPRISVVDKSKGFKTFAFPDRKSSVMNPSVNSFGLNEKKTKPTKSPLK